MKIMNLLIPLLLIPLLSLQGCAIWQGDISPDYQFAPNTQDGMAIFTISCNLEDAGYNYFSLSTAPSIGGTSDSTLFSSKIYNIAFQCNAPDRDLTAPEIKIVTLPHGIYSIYTFQLGDYYPTSFTPMYFTITPGKINYLGWLQLKSGYNMGYKVKVINSAVRDIPLIKQKLPLVNESNINVSAYKEISGFGVWQ